ncbi:hypothetical protein HanPSC8_Chr00c315g0807561 [Helianthus annuus]|nr:hypothetical protein HanPSC8_Chr00c315g0807561 [Helianthus annuus]
MNVQQALFNRAPRSSDDKYTRTPTRHQSRDGDNCPTISTCLLMTEGTTRPTTMTRGSNQGAPAPTSI